MDGLNRDQTQVQHIILMLNLLVITVTTLIGMMELEFPNSECHLSKYTNSTETDSGPMRKQLHDHARNAPITAGPCACATIVLQIS